MPQGGREPKFKSRAQSPASNARVKLSILTWIRQVQSNLYIDKGDVNCIVWVGKRGCNKLNQQGLFFSFKDSTVLEMMMGPRQVLWLRA